MASRKAKAVFSIEAAQVGQIEALVRRGGYRSASEFVREAIAEKLRRLRHKRLEEQVARYCAVENAQDEVELVSQQAFETDH